MNYHCQAFFYTMMAVHKHEIALTIYECNKELKRINMTEVAHQERLNQELKSLTSEDQQLTADAGKIHFRKAFIKKRLKLVNEELTQLKEFHDTEAENGGENESAKA